MIMTFQIETVKKKRIALSFFIIVKLTKSLWLSDCLAHKFQNKIIW
jgi:hypothetical protein